MPDLPVLTSDAAVTHYCGCSFYRDGTYVQQPIAELQPALTTGSSPCFSDTAWAGEIVTPGAGRSRRARVYGGKRDRHIVLQIHAESALAVPLLAHDWVCLQGFFLGYSGAYDKPFHLGPRRRRRRNPATATSSPPSTITNIIITPHSPTPPQPSSLLPLPLHAPTTFNSTHVHKRTLSWWFICFQCTC